MSCHSRVANAPAAPLFHASLSIAFSGAGGTERTDQQAVKLALPMRCLEGRKAEQAADPPCYDATFGRAVELRPQSAGSSFRARLGGVSGGAIFHEQSRPRCAAASLSTCTEQQQRAASLSTTLGRVVEARGDIRGGQSLHRFAHAARQRGLVAARSDRPWLLRPPITAPAADERSVFISGCCVHCEDQGEVDPHEVV